MLRTAPRALNRTGNWPKCHNAVPTLRKFATTKAVEENVEQIILQRSLASSCSTILTSRSYSTSFGLRPPDKKPWSASDSRFSHEEASRFTGKGQKDLKPKVPGDINAEDINAEDIKPGDFDSEDINSGYINPGATITKDKLPHLLSENEVVDLPEPSFIPPDATSTLEITNLLPVTLRTDILVWCRTAGLSVLDDRFPPDYPNYCRLRFSSVEEAIKAKAFLSEKPIFSDDPKIEYFINKGKDTKYLRIPNFRGTLESLREALSPFKNAVVNLVPSENKGKLHMDAYVKVSTFFDADRVTRALRNHKFEDGVDASDIQTIESSRYIEAVSPSSAGRSMSEFITTPPRRYYDEVDPSKRIAPQGPSNTIWMGGIPLDLLEQREEIMERFGKFGEIRELRIPPSQVGPRGCMWIQYTRQQDADAAHRELNANPLVLYGRPTRVDYASPRVQSELSKERRAENSVCIHRLQLDLAQDPFTLSKMLETFGEVIDIRVRKAASAQESPIVFVDFSDAEGATRCIQSVHNGELDELLPNISIGYSAQPKVPNWDAMDNQPTDTLRVWNIPARALVDSSMLREAFGGNGHLISTRIPRDRGWPWGVAFLHYTNVEAAKEIFDWVRSDLENPVTFFGRPIRMHFAENLFKSRERWDREREKGERRQDHGWGDRPQTSGDS